MIMQNIHWICAEDWEGPSNADAQLSLGRPRNGGLGG